MTAQDDKPLRNVTLLRAVKKQINEHPETWDQGSYAKDLYRSVADRLDSSPGWLRARGLTLTRLRAFQEKMYQGAVSCDTAFCVAGWGVALSGLKPELNRTSFDPSTESVYVGGRGVSIAAMARTLFGLTPREAEALFEGDNTLSKVNQLLDKYIAEGEQQLAAL